MDGATSKYAMIMLSNQPQVF